MKNIPLLFAIALMTATISIMASLHYKKDVKPAPVVPAAGSKPSIDKAKKASIMQRFIS